MTLLPGFVMTHEHMFYVAGSGRYNTNSSSFPPLYLAGGATTIRTAGSMEPYTDLNLRALIEAGQLAGPRMDVTGPYLEGEGLPIPGVHGAEGPEEIRAMVRYWADTGVTSFKVYNLLTRAMLEAAVEEAHARGLRVTGHLCSITYAEAADLGIDHLEHGFLAATDWVEGKEPDRCPSGGATASYAGLDLDGPGFRGLVDHLVERDVALTSTLTVFETLTPGRPRAPDGALDALVPPLREAYLTRWERIQGSESPWSEVFPKAMAMEKAFHDAGGLLTVGTDPTGYGGVVAGYANLRALELLVEAGFTFPEAIQVATLNGARALGMDDQAGTVEVGKRADLVLVRGDPGRDPATIRAVELVFKDGVGYDSRALFASVKGTVGLR
jgi:enamidase